MPGIAKFNKVREKPLVLLSPLDWGLGHTTRCIPLIRELIELNCEVIIACSPAQRALLEIEFQSLNFFVAPSSAPLYGKTRALTIIRLLWQAPKILTLVKRENRWLRRFLNTQPVDAIISDNRFGMYAPGIPCIFITHQLGIKTGLGAAFDALARRMNYRFIKKFTACWIPDYDGERSMAGDLSKPTIQPKIKIIRIGGLSRFETCTGTSENTLLIILSGPEPQRTILEEKILDELKTYEEPTIFIRGLPGNDAVPEVRNHIRLYNHVAAGQLNKLICAAKMVISRCGYTTVMDMLKLQKKCILIPTPGQAEQEYLARHLHNNHWAYSVTQNNFSLRSALQAAENFAFKNPGVSMEEYKVHLVRFVHSLCPA